MPSSIFNPDADTETSSVDGSAGRIGVDESWTTIRSGAGNTSGDSSATVADPTYKGSSTSNKAQRLTRGILLFDTSSLPDDCTIDSATLEVYVTAVDTSFADLDVNITASNPASNTAIANSDYGNVSDTKFSNSSKALSSFTTSAYNSYTLNASGLAAISKTGVSKFSIRFDKDIDDSAITHGGNTNESTLTWQTADGANAPKLTVNYTEATTTSTTTTTSTSTSTTTTTTTTSTSTTTTTSTSSSTSTTTTTTSTSTSTSTTTSLQSSDIPLFNVYPDR